MSFLSFLISGIQPCSLGILSLLFDTFSSRCALPYSPKNKGAELESEKIQPGLICYDMLWSSIYENSPRKTTLNLLAAGLPAFSNASILVIVNSPASVEEVIIIIGYYTLRQRRV